MSISTGQASSLPRGVGPSESAVRPVFSICGVDSVDVVDIVHSVKHSEVHVVQNVHWVCTL